MTTRRDLFKFAGGSAVGALFTPAPWRLITDSALWSENWPGIPQPARGEIRTSYNHCSLCPAGCGVRARCAGTQPVSLAGVKGHPLSHGALCPWGIVAHHLACHPARLRTGPVQELASAVADVSRRRVAVLDLRPGRTASWTYRRAMADLPNGIYIAPPEPEWGFDLSAARTVLSLGVPMADGWGTPGNVFSARQQFRLIQAEAVETRTASFADLWLPVRAATEMALASAIAGEMTTGEAAHLTGLDEGQIRNVVEELRTNGPSVVVARQQTPEVARANAVLGAPGRTLVRRRETPVPDAWRQSAPVTALDDVADGSVEVLLIDESAAAETAPWTAIAPKLASGALVATWACTAEGYGRHARFTLPAPVFGEVLEDIPAAVDGVAAVFRLATPWAEPPKDVLNPAEFVAKIAGINVDGAIRERSDTIHETRRGQIFMPADGKTVALKDMTKGDFWKALNAGACWTDERQPLPNGRGSEASVRSIRTRDREGAVGSLAIVAGETSPPPLVSPLSSKLYRETNLRQAVDRIALAPATARACGVSDGARAVLETGGLKLPVTVAIDIGLPPDVVRVAGVPAYSRGKVVPA